MTVASTTDSGGIKAHDCAALGCDGASFRAHQEAMAQGLPAVATLESAPTAYRITAAAAAAIPDSSRGSLAAAGGPGIGAAGTPSGKSESPARSKRTTPDADTSRAVEIRTPKGAAQSGAYPLNRGTA